MNILSLENVSKTFGIKPLFSSVTFGMEERDKIGIIGSNGSGKSTLLKVIAGIETPDSGRVVTANGTVITALLQNPPFDPNQTVLEAVFAGENDALRKKLELIKQYEAACDKLAENSTEKLLQQVSELASQMEIQGAWQIEIELKAMLNELGITQLSAMMSQLSGGQRKRVALAHSLFIESDLLILDEPTNHLDAETVEWLENRLSDYKGAILLVTHDRYFLDRITNRIIEIENGRVQSYTGNYAQYLEKKSLQEEFQMVEAQKLKQSARRELDWLRRGPKARTSKSQARIDSANSIIQQSKQAARDIAEKKSIDSGFEGIGTTRLGSKILGLENISKNFGDKNIVNNFSYQFKRGDKIGIIGANGSGKTTLLEIISGRLKPDNGSIDKGQTVAIGYYDQENRHFDESMRLLDYIKEVAENVTTADGEVITAGKMLERFLFPSNMQYQTIASLSGGERRRLYLLRMLMSAPNLLILDEITNDLDIQTLNALEDYLDSFTGCLIIVSHDRFFLDRTINYLFRFETSSSDETFIREYPGNYSTFLDIRNREKVTKTNEEKPQKKAIPATKTENKENLAKRKLTYKERIEFEELETKIAATELRITEAEAELSSNPTDHVLVATIYDELQTLNDRLARDMERWAELADLV